MCAFPLGLGDESFGCAPAGSNGEYLITGLAGGDYEVGAEAEGFEFQLYREPGSPDSATQVPVTPPGTTSPIDIALAPKAIPPYLEHEQSSRWSWGRSRWVPR